MPEDPQADLLTPASIRGWSVSLITHLLILFALALIILRPPARPPTEIDTRLAGEAQGSLLGEEMQGGLGIDEPLAMPEAPVEFAPPTPELATSGLSDIKPEIQPPDARNARQSGQEGVALTGTGQAGLGDGFGVAKFGQGGESINNVEVKVGDPQFTLIWDTRADIDLHVLEPGGSHLYWENRHGAQGGELDVDDVDGFGPENIYWGGGLDKGNGPPGEYKWFVHYYGSIGGVSVPTHWKVRLKHNGKYTIYEGRLNGIGQRTRTYAFEVEGTEGDPTGSPDPQVGRAGRQGSLRPDFNDPQPPQEPAAPPAEARTSAPERPRGASIAAAAAMGAGDTAPGTENVRRDPNGSGWLVVEPEDARFKALMPQEPTVERRTVDSSFGELEVRSFTVDKGEGGYIVAYSELPPSALEKGADAALDAAARGTIASLSGTSPETREQPVDGHRGRALKFGVPDRVVAGGGQARVRLVLAYDRLYTVSVYGTDGFVTKPESDRFLDSFRPTEAR